MKELGIFDLKSRRYLKSGLRRYYKLFKWKLDRLAKENYLESSVTYH